MKRCFIVGGWFGRDGHGLDSSSPEIVATLSLHESGEPFHSSGFIFVEPNGAFTGDVKDKFGSAYILKGKWAGDELEFQKQYPNRAVIDYSVRRSQIDGSYSGRYDGNGEFGWCRMYVQAAPGDLFDPLDG